jgi:aspartate racemase
MKTIGMIGGMSWESSAQYYAIVNRAVRDRLGGVHSAKILMYSVDFGAIEKLQHDGDWATLTIEMIEAARRLERGGADFVMICTNTMHLMADEVAASVAVPLLHVVDPAARAIAAAGLTRVGLLGTAFTMEKAFYRDRLAAAGLEVIIPDDDDRAEVHRVIYEELVAGKIKPASRAAYRAIIARLVDRGAQAIVLGCTEIMLLVDQSDSAVPLFDTTTLHALAAVDLAIAYGIARSSSVSCRNTRSSQRPNLIPTCGRRPTSVKPSA